jgi:hypothetical protein
MLQIYVVETLQAVFVPFRDGDSVVAAIKGDAPWCAELTSRIAKCFVAKHRFRIYLSVSEFLFMMIEK